MSLAKLTVSFPVGLATSTISRFGSAGRRCLCQAGQLNRRIVAVELGTFIDPLFQRRQLSGRDLAAASWHVAGFNGFDQTASHRVTGENDDALGRPLHQCGEGRRRKTAPGTIDVATATLACQDRRHLRNKAYPARAGRRRTGRIGWRIWPQTFISAVGISVLGRSGILNGATGIPSSSSMTRALTIRVHRRNQRVVNDRRTSFQRDPDLLRRLCPGPRGSRRSPSTGRPSRPHQWCF